MSASREKQNRQEQQSSGWVDPKTAREAEQRKKEKRSSLLYGAIAVVFVVVAVLAIIYRTNLVPKVATAATIDGEKYTAAEVSFYYLNAYQNLAGSGYASYMGLDTTSSLKDQTITEDSVTMISALGYGEAEEGQTWYDFILNTALEQMAQVQNGLAAAEAEGFTYPEGVQAQYDDSMTTLSAAAQASGLSVDQYLANAFGTSLITESLYSEQLMRMLQFESYADAHYNGLSYDEATLEETYEADPNSYDRVSYEYVVISGAAESTTDEEGNTVEPTEEESAAALAAAEDTANEILAAYRAGGDLEALAEEHDGSYTSNERGSYTGSVATEWLFDDARTAGDSAVLESGTSYYVTVFHDRFREEYNSIDVRHILVQPAAGTIASGEEGYEEEQEQLNAEAKTIADELLAEWQNGEATEESFAALAMRDSTDGSKYDGGLYTRVIQGQMVEAFNDWCFDPARSAGDTGVVETEYGYHVMYFVGEDIPAWQVAVTSTLANEDYAAWQEDLTAESDISTSGFGLSFVG